jgi:hypothetical protein
VNFAIIRFRRGQLPTRQGVRFWGQAITASRQAATEGRTIPHAARVTDVSSSLEHDGHMVYVPLEEVALGKNTRRIEKSSPAMASGAFGVVFLAVPPLGIGSLNLRKSSHRPRRSRPTLR